MGQRKRRALDVVDSIVCVPRCRASRSHAIRDVVDPDVAGPSADVKVVVKTDGLKNGKRTQIPTTVEPASGYATKLNKVRSRPAVVVCFDPVT